MLLGLSKLSPFLAGPSNAGNMWLTAGVVEREGVARPNSDPACSCLLACLQERPIAAPA